MMGGDATDQRDVRLWLLSICHSNADCARAAEQFIMAGDESQRESRRTIVAYCPVPVIEGQWEDALKFLEGE